MAHHTEFLPKKVKKFTKKTRKVYKSIQNSANSGKMQRKISLIFYAILALLFDTIKIG
ncbi:hypothetical protein E9K_09209 [Moraxella catarrhalis 103P14B1]|nr:hypothetical protein E9K_09209 [Moraxella catarrhalis 103P14B1]